MMIDGHALGRPVLDPLKESCEKVLPEFRLSSCIVM